MATQCGSMARGRMMRLTRLNECGAPVEGLCSTLVTDGFILVTSTPNYQDPEEITQSNANGGLCVDDQSSPALRWVDLDIQFCDVDPDAINIITGDPLVTDGAANAIGWRLDSALTGLADFALELWSGIPNQVCPVSGLPLYGYWLWPWIKDARWGEKSVQNAALTLDFTARTQQGGAWGVGPYNVRLGTGTNEVQTVTITGAPTGGTYTLTFSGQTTAAIAFNATAAAVQTALEGLSNINVGDVVAAGGPHPGTPITVTFQGQYASTDVAQMTADSSGLTGGASPTVTVTTTTPGVAGPASPLLTAIGSTQHEHFQFTRVAPPTEACGCVELVIP